LLTAASFLVSKSQIRMKGKKHNNTSLSIGGKILLEFCAMYAMYSVLDRTNGYYLSSCSGDGNRRDRRQELVPGSLTVPISDRFVFALVHVDR
jgi:hypothetical protein